MKTLGTTICIFFLTIVTYAQDTLTGVWDMGSANSKIELKNNQGVYEGTILSSDKLKVGTLMVKEVKAVSGEWKGKLYSAKKDKWYSAVLKEKNGKLFITVNSGLISKTLKWVKV